MMMTKDVAERLLRIVEMTNERIDLLVAQVDSLTSEVAELSARLEEER